MSKCPTCLAILDIYRVDYWARPCSAFFFGSLKPRTWLKRTGDASMSLKAIQCLGRTWRAHPNAGSAGSLLEFMVSWWTQVHLGTAQLLMFRLLTWIFQKVYVIKPNPRTKMFIYNFIYVFIYIYIMIIYLLLRLSGMHLQVYNHQTESDMILPSTMDITIQQEHEDSDTYRHPNTTISLLWQNKCHKPTMTGAGWIPPIRIVILGMV